MSNPWSPPPAEPSWSKPGHLHTGYSITLLAGLPPLLLLLPVYSQPSSQSDPFKNRSQTCPSSAAMAPCTQGQASVLESDVIWPPSSLSSPPSTFPVCAQQPHQPCFFLTSRRGICLLFPLPRSLFSLTPGWLVPSLQVCAQMQPDK